jgi:hypothetical protein
MILWALQKVTDRRHRPCSAHWCSQHVCKDFEIVTTFYTLLNAIDANATPYAACYIQAPCACVPTFQAMPSTRALGLSGSKQVGVYFKDWFDLALGILGISIPWRSNLCNDSKNHCATTTVDAHLQWLYAAAEADNRSQSSLSIWRLLAGHEISRNSIFSLTKNSTSTSPISISQHDTLF